MIKRRRFNRWLALGLTTGALSGLSRSGTGTPHNQRKLRVAAIQMTPRLGDVTANLEQAERLIRQAQR